MNFFKKKNNKKIIFVLILVWLSLFSLRSLMKSGYFLTHDGAHLLVRLGASFRALRNGQIPLRWSGDLNHGYGYPVFNFLYPLYLYLGAFLNLLGFGLINSFKIIFIGAYTFSAIAIFLFLSSFTASWPAFLGSATYLFMRYRFTQIIVRGSLGEVLAMAMAPLVFYFFNKIRVKKIDLNFFGAIISLFLLILSHNTLAMLFSLLLAGFLLIKIYHEKKLIFSFFKSIILSLGLSSFFWLPAVWERKYTYSFLVPVSDFDIHFLKLKDLFSETWNLVFSDTNVNNQMSYSLGLFLLPFLILALFLLIKQCKKSKNRAKSKYFYFVYFSVLFLITCFLMINNSLSVFIWNISGIKNFVQFPWRLLSLTVFISSFLVAYVYENVSYKLIKIFLTIVIFVQIINVQKFVVPEKREFFKNEFYLTNDGTTTSNNEFLPIWVKKAMGNRPEEILNVYDDNGQKVDIDYSVLKNESNKIVLDFKNKKKIKVVLNKIYFPGWKVNNQEPEISDNGLISFEREAFDKYHSSLVVLKFKNTNIRIISNIISIASFLFLLFFLKELWIKKRS